LGGKTELKGIVLETSLFLNQCVVKKRGEEGQGNKKRRAV